MIAPAWLKPAAAALLLASAFAAGWTAQGWRADTQIASIEREHAQALAAQQQQALADYQRME